MWRRLPEPLLASAPAPRSGSWSWPPAWWGSLCLLTERPAPARIGGWTIPIVIDPTLAPGAWRLEA